MRLIKTNDIQYSHAIARSIDEGHNWNELCATKDEIDDMPTIDAIPVEQVARMLANYTNDFPCDYAEGYAKSQKDGFCELEQCGCDDNYTCWLHAIKEGWLDDATN